MLSKNKQNRGTCRCYEYAPTILRLALGAVFVVHGYQKLFIQGFEGVAAFFGSVGIPMALFLAYVVTLLEFVGGIMLVLGLFTRHIAALFVIDMVVALFAVHIANGFVVSNGGYEFVLVLAAGSFSLVLSGPGKYALDTAPFLSNPSQ